MQIPELLAQRMFFSAAFWC